MVSRGPAPLSLLVKGQRGSGTPGRPGHIQSCTLLLTPLHLWDLMPRCWELDPGSSDCSKPSPDLPERTPGTSPGPVPQLTHPPAGAVKIPRMYLLGAGGPQD